MKYYTFYLLLAALTGCGSDPSQPIAANTNPNPIQIQTVPQATATPSPTPESTVLPIPTPTPLPYTMQYAGTYCDLSEQPFYCYGNIVFHLNVSVTQAWIGSQTVCFMALGYQCLASDGRLTTLIAANFIPSGIDYYWGRPLINQLSVNNSGQICADIWIDYSYVEGGSQTHYGLICGYLPTSNGTLQ